MTDKEVAKRNEKGQFLMGENWHGNPHGRPKGGRNKLAETMLNDLYHDWIAHGAQAIETVRENRPSDYLKIVAMLVSRCDEAIYDRVMDDEEIGRIIEDRRQRILLQMKR